MLVDETKIIVKAGDGGDGLASFRREKFVPRGGPDGGDGGDGGDVWFVVSPDVHTLFDYSRLKSHRAEDGAKGQKGRKTGRDGANLVLKIPPGTIITDLTRGQVMADLTASDQKLLIAEGGKGGRGNYHFATAVRQAPRYAEPGFPGEEKTLKLELKLIAQVGIIGLPNSGKSTLLSVISAARPKIADYPFTTLEPSLGVVNVDGYQFVAADIPGLIEGAAEGKGLGHKFLKHIERCQIIWHLIDTNSADPVIDYKIVRSELEKFSKELMRKEELVVLTKIDTQPDEESKRVLAKLKKSLRKPILAISTAAGKGIKELLYETISLLQKD
jgi:GTP-binding protein